MQYNKIDRQLTSQKVISASLLRLEMRSPFFATLALFARFIPTQGILTTATDGKVTPKGLNLSKFPFGEAVRLLFIRSALTSICLTATQIEKVSKYAVCER